MASDGREFGRLTNKEPFKMFYQDSENPMTFHPLDYFAHKGTTAGHRMANLSNKLQIELEEKYVSNTRSLFKAKLELETIPACFDYCIDDVSTTALNANEKNCMRDCYFRKVSSKDDFMLLASQMMAIEYAKSLKDRLV